MGRLHERTLMKVVGRRLEGDEAVDLWCHAWVSEVSARPRRQAFAPRWRDFVVVTDRRLMMFTAGHLTRRPRERVVADRLDEIRLEYLGGRRFRLDAVHRPALLLELGSRPDARKVAECLIRTARRGTPPPL